MRTYELGASRTGTLQMPSHKAVLFGYEVLSDQQGARYYYREKTRRNILIASTSRRRAGQNHKKSPAASAAQVGDRHYRWHCNHTDTLRIARCNNKGATPPAASLYHKWVRFSSSITPRLDHAKSSWLGLEPMLTAFAFAPIILAKLNTGL